MQRSLLSAAAIVFVVLGAASRARADDPAPGPGTIKGTVLFEGEPPDRAAPKRTSDCPSVLADDVLVTKGKLKDVLVRVKNGTAGTFKPPAAPATLDQRGCQFAPHVIGVIAGQRLQLENTDATAHDVRGAIAGKTVWTKHEAPKSPAQIVESSSTAGDVVDITDARHPWMHAYAVVQDHPFFAVTDEAGTFEIKGLPIGTYTLEAWHPKFGTKTLTVKIGKAKLANITARFSYKQIEQPDP
jgi:plastocyanin